MNSPADFLFATAKDFFAKVLQKDYVESEDGHGEQKQSPGVGGYSNYM